MTVQPQQQPPRPPHRASQWPKRLIWFLAAGVVCVALAGLYLQANIYDPTDGAGDIQRAGLPHWPDGKKVLAAYNEAIRRTAEGHQNVHLVNFHDAFLGHGLHCGEFWSRHYNSRDPHYWYYSNLEDPNERGYDAIRRLFLNEILKAAKEFR